MDQFSCVAVGWRLLPKFNLSDLKTFGNGFDHHDDVFPGDGFDGNYCIHLGHSSRNSFVAELGEGDGSDIDGSGCVDFGCGYNSNMVSFGYINSINSNNGQGHGGELYRRLS